MRECLLKMYAMIESSSRPLVHMVSEVGDVTKSVPLKEMLQVIRELGSPAQAGWGITLHEKSILVKMGSAIGASVFNSRFRSFNTLEEAFAHLRLVDETLSWDKIDQSVLEQAKV